MPFKSNKKAVQSMLRDNVFAALNAAGAEAVSLIRDNMENGYGAPIRKTGALMADVHAGTPKKDSIEVGNSLYYAPYVHEGTSKMAGRPYNRDAILNGKDAIKEKIAEELKRGF